MSELSELLREQRLLIATLKDTAQRMKRTALDMSHEKPPKLRRPLLLKMTEGLIDAHKAARIDDDGRTLDLIEDALRHVGERLSRECSDGRRFASKRLGSL